MKRVAFFVLALLLLAITAALGKYFYDQTREEPEEREIAHAFVGDVVRKTVATGAIVPRSEVAVKAQVTGVVDELFVEPGETVRTGQLLARIRVVPDEAALQAGRDNVRAARIRAEAAEVERVRQEGLFASGTVSEQAYLQVKLDADRAVQELAAAESALEVIRTGAAQGSQTAANLVRSTANGTVLDVPVERGNSVIQANNFNEGTTVATVADLGEMVFEGKVDESEVGKLTEGMALELTVGALEDLRIPARLDFIAPQGLNEEGTIRFDIRASVTPPEDVFLRAGYSANADIVLDRRDGVVLLREAWLQFAGDTAYIEVRGKDGSAERRDVRLGLSDGLVAEWADGADTSLAVLVPR